MARQKKKNDKASESVVDYRHKAVKRLNIPPAGLTARGHIVREKKVRYAYNLHLSPVPSCCHSLRAHTNGLRLR